MMKGRDEVRTWITRTMTSFPGSHMTDFPASGLSSTRRAV